MLSFEDSGQATRRKDLRRHTREAALGPVILETRDGLLRVPLIDLSPGGAKVRLVQPLTEGMKGRLYFLPPYWRARAVETIVWRIDLDGVVLRFRGPSIIPPPGVQDSLEAHAPTVAMK
jgi:PilZ domain